MNDLERSLGYNRALKSREAGEGEAPAADAAPEPEAKPRSRKIFA